MKEIYKNWGIPLAVITKETVQAKERDNENQKIGYYKSSTKKDYKMTASSKKRSISEPSP